MLTFNAILRSEAIDPKTVLLVRHKDRRSAVNCTPYNLWRAGDGRLETYQRIQQRRVFAIGSHLASFVATPTNDTLFVGLYRVDGIGIASQGTIDPVLQTERGGLHLYDIHREDQLTDYAGHLIVEWGRGKLAWVQHADVRDKPVLEIRKEIKDEVFPGFINFCWNIDQIAAIPLTWQSVLKSVKGVYLLVCNETGKQYVGSAKGEESLWGRFLEYARTGHGGNIELKRRGRRHYQVTILEVVNSDSGIERVEEAWKKKLMSKKFGLNR